MKVLDPTVHDLKAPKATAEPRLDAPSLVSDGRERRDLRWAICSRPVVVVGGELTLEQLEFHYDPHLRYHQAHLQMKAACGLLVIDKLGRKRVSPRSLLNRWIVPMDRGVDHLTLPTWETIEVPFDLLLVFCTNLHPLDVVDEAFLRRIRHKVLVPDPTPEHFNTLYFKEAATRGIALTQEFMDHIVARYYRE